MIQLMYCEWVKFRFGRGNSPPVSEQLQQESIQQNKYWRNIL